MAKHGYPQSNVTPGFWVHKLRPIPFSLVVKNFGIKLVRKEHADHIIKVSEEDYELYKDWDGIKYVGISLDCEYDMHEVHISMPGYVKKALRLFKYEPEKKNEDQTYEYVKPNCGGKVQYITE